MPFLALVATLFLRDGLRLAEASARFSCARGGGSAQKVLCVLLCMSVHAWMQKSARVVAKKCTHGCPTLLAKGILPLGSANRGAGSAVWRAVQIENSGAEGMGSLHRSRCRWRMAVACAYSPQTDGMQAASTAFSTAPGRLQKKSMPVFFSRSSMLQAELLRRLRRKSLESFL